MKPQATIYRENPQGKKTDKIELFFYKNGVLFHRHSLIEDTEENRKLFPVHRKFGSKLYYTQEFMLLPDEAINLLEILARKDAHYLVNRFFRHNWLTRFLWRITLKLTIVWQRK